MGFFDRGKRFVSEMPARYRTSEYERLERGIDRRESQSERDRYLTERSKSLRRLVSPIKDDSEIEDILSDKSRGKRGYSDFVWKYKAAGSSEERAEVLGKQVRSMMNKGWKKDAAVKRLLAALKSESEEEVGWED